MAYLMRAEGITLETALYTVRQARKQVFPNAGFQEQLKLWSAMGCRIDPDSGAWRRYQLMAVGRRWEEIGVVDPSELGAAPEAGDNTVRP